MCDGKTYYYKKLINQIKDKNVRETVQKIESTCPDKILQNFQELKEEREIYRFIRGSFDKYPHFLYKPNVFKNKASNEISICQMCGLSVFLDLEDLVNTIKNKFPDACPIIVKGLFNVNCGKLYKTDRTGGSHCTFFPYENFDHDKFFKKI
ncbi:MAG: hypothetical protein ABIL76_02030 [candidate division WOR-3 bacterium]